MATATTTALDPKVTPVVAPVEQNEDVGLPPIEEKAAETANKVAEETLQPADSSEQTDQTAKPASLKDSHSICTCMMDPLHDLVMNKIWPVIERIITTVRNRVFFLCCPATPRDKTPVTLEEGVEMTREQAFNRDELRRFEDRKTCSTAGFTKKPGMMMNRHPKTQTLSNKEGVALKQIIEWDKDYVGGEKAVESREALDKRLDDIVNNPKTLGKAMTEFGKLDDTEVTKILTAAYNSDAIIAKCRTFENFENDVNSDQKIFGKYLETIRDGLKDYFQARAGEIINKRKIANDSIAASVTETIPEEKAI